MISQASFDIFAGSIHQITELVTNLPEDRMADQPAGIRNHPAWTLPHLCVGFDFTLTLLGKAPVNPLEQWNAIAGIGSTPETNLSVYPSKADALEAFKKGADAFAAALKELDQEVLSAESPEDFRSFFPTVEHLATYLLVAHNAHHFGQLTAWRRAAGLVPAAV